MRPDPRAYLWDALHAAELIAQFSLDKTFPTIGRTSC